MANFAKFEAGNSPLSADFEPDVRDDLMQLVRGLDAHPNGIAVVAAAETPIAGQHQQRRAVGFVRGFQQRMGDFQPGSGQVRKRPP